MKFIPALILIALVLSIVAPVSPQTFLLPVLF